MKMLGGGNSDCDDSDACEDENRNMKSGGRKENEDFKCDALISPIIEDVTNSLALSCNVNFPLGKICASKISMQTVFEQPVIRFFNPAPTEIGNNAEKLAIKIPA